jgi:hypothetical protein
VWQATGVDLDAACIDHARLGTPAEHAERLRWVKSDCLRGDAAAKDEGCDVIFVGNFSIGYLHTRRELVDYLALSRSRVVVAAWSGELTDGALTYAAPGHPEFRHYPAPGCAIVPIRVKLTRSPTPSATSSFR